jgi:hypothetical protein
MTETSGARSVMDRGSLALRARDQVGSLPRYGEANRSRPGTAFANLPHSVCISNRASIGADGLCVRCQYGPQASQLFVRNVRSRQAAGQRNLDSGLYGTSKR